MYASHQLIVRRRADFMYLISQHRNTTATSCSTAFGSLREEIAREVSGSAMLADLLEKLNGMQEACARPADFKKRFDEFVVRAADHLDIVQPFLPKLRRFLPIYADYQG
jgi:hypothetical protein